MSLTFGPGLIDSIRLRDRYYNDDLATGSNDGTSEANAWQSLADMVAGAVPGDHVWCKKTASPITVSANTDLPSGDIQAPIVYQGYGSEIGDGTKCIFACGAGGNIIEINPGNVLVDLSFTGTSVTSYTVLKNVGNATIVRCAFTSDNNAESCRGTEGAFVACTFNNTGTFVTSGYEAVSISSGTLIGCKMQSEGECIEASHVDEGDVNVFIGNVVISDSSEARTCIECEGGQVESAVVAIFENSCWGGSVGIEITDYPSTKEYGSAIMYNICAGCDQGIDALDLTNQEYPCILKNAYGANTTGDIGTGFSADVSERFDDLTLSGLPYATTTALDLDATAGEGAACRSTASIGYLSGSGTELVSGAFSYGAHREGTDDSGDADSLVGFTQQTGGGAALAGKDFGMLPLNKTSEIG